VLTDFPLRGLTLAIVVAMMAVPNGLLLIPVFRSVLDYGLVNKRFGLILVYTALNLPFSIYLLTSYMRTIPKELLQAAEVDGAGLLRQLSWVVLPLIRPGLLALVTLNFLFLWNEFLFALVILQGQGVRTLLVLVTGLQGSPGAATDFGALSAGLLMAMIPPILIFALFQRDLVRGLTVGAVK
jgi:ABC-type glycerol-3-phosphate transport system permease component